MNQSILYATLEQAGCKILSFEDYPSDHGNWRASFIKSGNNCEMVSNRFDGILSLMARNSVDGIRQSIVEMTKLRSEEAELASILTWLSTLFSKPKTINHNPQKT
jgi:hypothetical protein